MMDYNEKAHLTSGMEISIAGIAGIV
jgi:hypothetical protein